MNKKIISTILICILFSMNLLFIAADEASGQLLDLTNAGVPHWAKNHIDKLLSKGIVAGYPDGSFKPDNTVEVDAFIKMVVCSLGYGFENGKEYWAMPFIDKAKELKLIEGTEFNTYHRAITREEAAKVIVNALGTLETLPGDEQVNKAATKVPDYSKITQVYKKYVLASYTAGLITGDTKGAFNPKNNLTRAEASAVIMRLLDASLRQPIKLEELNTVLPELMKSDAEVWGRDRIDSLTSLAEYDLKDGKLYFKNEPSFVDVLPKETLNPDINRQIHDLVKVLIGDDHFVRSFYMPEMGPYVDGYISPSSSMVGYARDYGWGYNNVYFFGFVFMDNQPYKLAEDSQRKDLSNNVAFYLTLNQLWWQRKADGTQWDIKDGWVDPFYADKLKKSCMAVFGESTGSKVYKYVYDIYMDERTKLDTANRRYKTTTIDGIRIDFYNNAAELNYFFTYSK